MIPDKVIYTDGRDVTVTDSTLMVKKHAYQIDGITKFSLWKIGAVRWPGVLLLLIGIGACACGWLGYLPADMYLRTENGVISGNLLSLWIGAALVVLGLIMLVVAHDRYAVRIATAEGEKNAIVSNSRDYIQQIVNALNRAVGEPKTNVIRTERYTRPAVG